MIVCIYPSKKQVKVFLNWSSEGRTGGYFRPCPDFMECMSGQMVSKMMAQQHDKNISLHMHVANILPQNSTRCSRNSWHFCEFAFCTKTESGSWNIGKLIADYSININLRSRTSDPPKRNNNTGVVIATKPKNELLQGKTTKLPYIGIV